jgi:hypothetical protein
MKTYLEMVNDVLIALRDDQVTSVGQDVHTQLIGRFVNDAKVQCEAATDWSALGTEEIVVVPAGTEKLSIVGSANRIKIDYVLNVTNDNVLIERSRRAMQIQALKGQVPVGIPGNWCNNGVDTNGDAVIQISPTPAVTTSFAVVGFQRTGHLVADTDSLLIPDVPVRDLAIALAVRERGEVNGQTAAEYFEIAKRTLSDAVAFDSARNDSEDDWYVSYGRNR